MDYAYRLSADYLNRISLADLYRHGVAGGGGSGPLNWDSPVTVEIESIRTSAMYIRLTYYLSSNHSSSIELIDYKVPLTTTHCNYGGERFWFLCPLCSRRVGILYRRSTYYACRHCNYLTYESKKISGIQKSVGRIISIPELDAIRNAVKRMYYSGRVTRKYVRYLKTEIKARTALRTAVFHTLPKEFKHAFRDEILL